MYKKYDRVFYAMAAIGFAYSLATTNNTWLFMTAICYGIWIMGLIGRATKDNKADEDIKITIHDRDGEKIDGNK